MLDRLGALPSRLGAHGDRATSEAYAVDHDLFPDSELFLLPTARHFPQLGEPEEVARLILSTPLAESVR